MENYTTVLLILGVMVLLTPLAERIKVASPILLVIAGITVGFIPGMPEVQIEPEIIFLIFLPPLLYEAAFNIPFKDFREHFGTISSMAFGLVFITTGCIAVAAYYMVPGMTWALAFVLGAILAATDAVAAMNITKNLGLSHKTKVILEGESLINDASALVAYRFALGAVAGVSFVWWKASLTFLYLLIGGAVAGFVIGFILAHTIRLIRKNTLAVLSLLLLSPFVTYLVAEQFHLSGVIAVVVLGIVMSFVSRKKFPDDIKVQSKSNWDVIAFMLNGFIFIVLGLEIPIVLKTIERDMILPYICYAFIITVIAITVRAIRVFLKRRSLELAQQRSMQMKGKGRVIPDELLISAQESLIISWSGMRGIVSLAIAIALPDTLADGKPFPLRSEIIFITAVVIFLTIVGQGLILPFIVKRTQVVSASSEGTPSARFPRKTKT